jgi:hypothetical protein
VFAKIPMHKPCRHKPKIITTNHNQFHPHHFNSRPHYPKQLHNSNHPSPIQKPDHHHFTKITTKPFLKFHPSPQQTSALLTITTQIKTVLITSTKATSLQPILHSTSPARALSHIHHHQTTVAAAFKSSPPPPRPRLQSKPPHRQSGILMP